MRAEAAERYAVDVEVLLKDLGLRALRYPGLSASSSSSSRSCPLALCYRLVGVLLQESIGKCELHFFVQAHPVMMALSLLSTIQAGVPTGVLSQLTKLHHATEEQPRLAPTLLRPAADGPGSSLLPMAMVQLATATADSLLEVKWCGPIRLPNGPGETEPLTISLCWIADKLNDKLAFPTNAPGVSLYAAHV